MSHLHLPDGLFPVWFAALAWLVEIALLYLASHYVVRRGELRRVALLGVVTAVVVLAMSVQFAFYHFNLLVLSGVLLGPALGFLTAFSASLLLALFGHGGLTLVGLNGLITGIEPVVGYFLFQAVRRHWPQAVRAAAALATVLALATSAGVCVVVLGAGIGIDIGQARPPAQHHYEHVQHSAHEDPLAAAHAEAGLGAERGSRNPLIRLVLLVALLLWPLEMAINAFVLHYVHRVRPNLLAYFPDGDAPLPGG